MSIAFHCTSARADSDSVELLKTIVRMDTSNPPGDTRAVANHLRSLFDAAGIESEIVVAPNGKAAHFIARLKGNGSKRPVLVAAHTDVVPVQPERWSVEPFGAVEKEGFIYGRGTLDNKGAVAAFARAMLRLREEKVPLSRDIIFLAEADEEQGQFNTVWLARERWDAIDAEFVLNEGGRTSWGEDRKVRMLSVSFIDKLTLNLRLTASGPSGHSSRPLPVSETANGQLIAALQKLSPLETPIRLSAETRAYLQTLASVSPGALEQSIGRLLAARSPEHLMARARDVIAADDTGGWGIEGLLRDTLVVTMLSSGIKPNVIPGTAEAVVNARLLPGSTVEGFIAQLAATLGNPRIKIEIISTLPKDAVAQYFRERAQVKPSSIDTDLFRAIRSAATSTWPGALVVPTLLVSTTDATPWRERGVPVYGIGPFPVDRDSASRVHGDDERVSVEALHQGSEFVYRILVDVAAEH